MDYIKEVRSLVGSRPLILPGVAILLFDENNDKVLLQKRTDNKLWGLTGGFMEPGESFEETAHRETFEELGVSIKNLSFKSILSGEKLYYQYPNGDEVYSVIAVYSANCGPEDFKLDYEEVSKVKYFDPEKLPKDINPNHRTVLEELGYLQER
ncbi:NUDIX hydrolase [Pseudalkalibacillus hwajinpoensis]|uniref:NUDIX domain-containing protein n=1 Tax=Guptibacillus hwajinpoensis TaxID=208199 RepID=A0A4U1MEY6_9BACL|nr:NUDIX hydrolase [Pseudalkalibacillus hwajinpoensis]TKD68800.1 NUDIX domain-containing protein [Pseudalkalibacillus hwajinpoensis]